MTLRLRTYMICITLLVIVCSCLDHNENLVFEDFENSSFEQWEVQGTAFDKPFNIDCKSKDYNQYNARGKSFAYSFINDSVLNQGKLISVPFTIKHQYIDFLIGGGEHPTRTCINLLINNKIVRSKTGKGEAVLAPASWDVHEFIGQEAMIEIVDALDYSRCNLDFIMVDNIEFSNHIPRPTLLFEDFESGKYNHWIIEGNAFQIPSNRNSVYYPVTVNGFEGKQFAFSFTESHDLEKGILLSESFTIDRDYITFLIGGGNHPDTTCIQLIINDSIYCSSTGLNTGELRREVWDVSSRIGQKAQLKILDNYSGYWGHIIIDDIQFSDSLGESTIAIPYRTSNKRAIQHSVIILSLLLFVFVFLRVKKQKVKNALLRINQIEFKKSILQLFEEDKIYLRKELNVSMVAQFMDVPKDELINLIQSTFKKSFNDFVNTYRIQHFKQEVLKPENKELKLIAVAEKSGFNSKSSFYRTFKKLTHQTPSEFLQDQK